MSTDFKAEINALRKLDVLTRVDNNEVVVPLNPSNETVIGVILGTVVLQKCIQIGEMTPYFDGSLDVSIRSTSQLTNAQIQSKAFQLTNDFFTAYIYQEVNKTLDKLGNLTFESAKILAGHRGDNLIPVDIWNQTVASRRAGFRATASPNTWPIPPGFQATHLMNSTMLLNMGMPYVLVFGLLLLKGFDSLDLKNPQDPHALAVTNQITLNSASFRPLNTDSLDVLSQKALMMGYTTFSLALDSAKKEKTALFTQSAKIRKDICLRINQKLSPAMLAICQTELIAGDFPGVLTTLSRYTSSLSFKVEDFKNSISELNYRPALNETVKRHVQVVEIYFAALFLLRQRKSDQTTYPLADQLSMTEVESSMSYTDQAFNAVFANQLVVNLVGPIIRRANNWITNSEKLELLFGTFADTFMSSLITKILPSVETQTPGFEYGPVKLMLQKSQETLTSKYSGTVNIPNKELNEKNAHQALMAQTASSSVYDKYALSAAMPATRVNFTDANTRFNARGSSPSRSSSSSDKTSYPRGSSPSRFSSASSDKTYYPRGLSPSRQSSRSSSSPQRRSSPSPGSSNDRWRQPASSDSAARPDERKRGASPSFGNQGSGARRRTSSPQRPASPGKAAGRPPSPARK